MARMKTDDAPSDNLPFLTAPWIEGTVVNCHERSPVGYWRCHLQRTKHHTMSYYSSGPTLLHSKALPCFAYEKKWCHDISSLIWSFWWLSRYKNLGCLSDSAKLSRPGKSFILALLLVRFHHQALLRKVLKAKASGILTQLCCHSLVWLIRLYEGCIAYQITSVFILIKHSNHSSCMSQVFHMNFDNICKVLQHHEGAGASRACWACWERGVSKASGKRNFSSGLARDCFREIPTLLPTKLFPSWSLRSCDFWTVASFVFRSGSLMNRVENELQVLPLLS